MALVPQFASAMARVSACIMVLAPRVVAWHGRVTDVTQNYADSVGKILCCAGRENVVCDDACVPNCCKIGHNSATTQREHAKAVQVRRGAPKLGWLSCS